MSCRLIHTYSARSLLLQSHFAEDFVPEGKGSMTQKDEMGPSYVQSIYAMAGVCVCVCGRGGPAMVVAVFGA